MLTHRASGDHQPSRGQAVAEFALAIPVALLVLIAVFDVGRAVFAYTGLTNAAREGARLAIVNQDKALVAQRVQEMAVGATITNLGSLVDPVVTFYDEGPDTSDPTQNALCTPMATGCVAVIRAKTSWSAITPIIGSVIGALNLEARSELAVEFVCPNPNIPAYVSPSACPKQP